MIANRQKGWIGVDIGTHCIKLAQVERVHGQLRLVDAVVLRRRAPWQTDEEGDATPPASSADSLRAGVALGGRFSGPRAACVLPMHLLDVRAMLIPPGTVSERRGIIQSELANVPKVGTKGRVFDYWDFAAADENQQQMKENVYVASVSQGWAERAYRDLATARLRCEALDVGPLAVGQTLIAAESTDPTATVAAIDWGFSNVTLCVLRRGKVMFVRLLRDCGLGQMISAVQQALGVTFEQAQHLLTCEGLASTAAPDINADANGDRLGQLLTDAAEHTLRNVIEQINKTFDYLKYQRRVPKPDRLILVGGGATVRHLPEYLNAKLPFPVSLVDFKSLGITAADQCDDSAAMLSTAVSLSQRRWRPA